VLEADKEERGSSLSPAFGCMGTSSGLTVTFWWTITGAVEGAGVEAKHGGVFGLTV
jgi:hypothetical protein